MTVAPLLVEDGLRWLLDWVGADSARVLMGLTLLAVALYWRKAKSVSGLASGLVGRVVTVAVGLGALLLLGIVPGVNVGRAAELLSMAYEFGTDLLRGVL